MIRKALTIMAFVLNGIWANAQQTAETLEKKVQFGLKSGLSFANVYDAKGREFESASKLGFAGGLFMNIPINHVLGIQPEILIIQKGFEGSGRILGDQYNLNRRTNFAEVPILLTFTANETVTLLVGPQFDFLINQRDVFSNSVFSFVQEQEFENDNVSERIFGLEIGVDVTRERAVISGRIGWDLENNRDDATSRTPKYKNVCAQLTLGFLL